MTQPHRRRKASRAFSSDDAFRVITPEQQRCHIETDPLDEAGLQHGGIELAAAFQ